MNTKRLSFICIVLAAVISVGVTGLKLTGHELPLSGVLRSAAQPFTAVAVSVRDSIAEKQTQGQTAAELRQQLTELEAENAALTAQLALLQGNNDPDTSVRAILPAGTASNYSFLQARVVGTDGKACPGTVTVNVGSRDGVETYTPVMTAAGLVGYVSDVGAGWAKITTIASASFSCGITDVTSGWVGVAHGTGSTSSSATDTCEVRYTDADSVFAAGDVLVTSGMGSVFPAGLPLGTIAETDTRAYDRLMTAKITPFADTTAQGLSETVLWLLLPASAATEATSTATGEAPVSALPTATDTGGVTP